jgi:hypothetical protein
MALALISKSKLSKGSAGPRAHGRQPLSAREGRTPLAKAVIQPKLKVGEPNDRFEQEADRVAEDVMRMSDPAAGNKTFSGGAPLSVQRMCAKCSEEDEKIQRKPILPAPPQISSLCAPAAARLAFDPTTLDGGDGAVAQPLEQTIRQSRGGGTPLPDSVRSFLEPRFGRDLTHLRVHTDRTSGELADRLQSRAFTVGSDIFFAPGEYQPRSSSGLRMLSHEVTHAVQQGAVPAAGLSGATNPGATSGTVGAIQREVNPKQNDK